MLLSKEIAVYLNLAGCKLKQYTASMLRKGEIQLTPEQFLLLDLLWNEGPMSQQQLADILHKDKNSVTKLVDALERKALVSRERNASDRRSNIITPTEEAQQLKEKAKEQGISALDKMLNGIKEEELRQFLNTINKMTKNMETAANDEM